MKNDMLKIGTKFILLFSLFMSTEVSILANTDAYSQTQDEYLVSNQYFETENSYEEFYENLFNKEETFSIEIGESDEVLDSISKAIVIRDILNIKASINNDKITLTFSNIGNTTITSYSGSLNITSSSTKSGLTPVKSSKKISFLNLLPGLTKEYTFVYSMKFTRNKFELKNITTHSSGRKYTATENFYRNIYDNNLSSWNRGTFANKAMSLDYHHNKHQSEVSSSNVMKYYSLAVSERSRTVNTSLYNQTRTGTGGYKYTRKASPRRYIILSDKNKSGGNIYSFGGK